MAEPERVHTAAAPQDSSSFREPSAPLPAVRPREPSEWGGLRLLLATALGATLGFLTGTGLVGEFRSGWQLFALRVGIAGLGAYVLFDPGMELLYDWLGARRSPLRGGRKIFAAVIIAAATIVITVFHESLGASVGDELSELIAPLKKATGSMDASLGEKLDALARLLREPAGGLLFALATFACVGLIAGVVTHFWMRGSRQQPSRAALYGGAATGAGSALLAFAALLPLALYLLPVSARSLRWTVVELFLIALAWFLAPGLLGGLAIDKHSQRYGPTFRAFLALALSPAIFAVLLLAAYELKLKYLFPDRPALLWLPIAALVCQNLGWALVLHVRKEFWDFPSEPSALASLEPAAASALGTVLPFPGPHRDGSLAPQPGSGIEKTPAARAQDMLLKPQGDRLWAAVALVLALITAGLAFYAGSLRTDPEIVVNIQQRFEQDSGLHRKGLSIHSTDRIVAIAGTVDDEVEHAKALQEAASVRGVKQLIDQIRVAPPAPPAPPPPVPAAVVAVPQSQPAAINATISIGGSSRADAVRAIVSQKLSGTQKSAPSQTPAQPTQAGETPKHHGFLHLLKRDKNDQDKTAAAQKSPAAPKTADSQKQGFFHFLKKKKDDQAQQNRGKNDQLKNDQPKKDQPKKDQTKTVPSR